MTSMATTGPPYAQLENAASEDSEAGPSIPDTDQDKTPLCDMETTKLLSANYESLDYDDCENHLFLEEERRMGYKYIMKKNLSRWVIFLMIGMCTAFVGIFIDIAIEELAAVKYKGLKKQIDKAVLENKLYVPLALWISSNVIPVLIGSALVVFVEPVALGSGIPQIKCYLNGVKMPRIVRIKTLLVKSVGVITSIIGGLAAGKEGPMIHSGSVVAAGLSQGKSSSLNMDFRILHYFREDHEKRDFVSGGAAAGVAAAFGAPVGGVLFSLEEGASFWNQSLTWRIFFASIVSTFTLNIVLSAYHGYPGKLSYPGLLNFGAFDDLKYELFELMFYMMMGAIGGLSGALFNHINYKLTLFRMKYVKWKPCKVLEAVIVAAVTAMVAIVMIFYSTDCKPLGLDHQNKYPLQMYCPDGQYSAMAALWFQVPEASVRSFFHDQNGAMNKFTIGAFALAYYALSVWTYGLSVSAGLFIPNLLIGAAWGRLVGVFLVDLFPYADWVDVGKYSLIGAAAQLGGVVRMTISLTVILIEATGNITFGLPLMLTVITAKWVGDFFNEGLYDIHIQLNGIPLLAWEPPPLFSHICVNEVMSYPVVAFKTVENVGTIVDALLRETHNGFPVIQIDATGRRYAKSEPTSFGHLKGLILRHQLVILLQNKAFCESNHNWVQSVTLEMFRKQYPRYPSIKSVRISDEERNLTIDLTPFMNPSPYVVQHTMSMPRVFRLFRALGLRHIIVINDTNQVVGMISRKDLARYKVSRHFGRINVEEMKISAQI